MNDKLARLPVIIGVGQINDRNDDPEKGLDAAALMLASLQLANEDAGGKALDSVDTLELVRLFSTSMDGIQDRLAAGIPGLRSRPEFVVGHGNTPLLLLNRAANRIASGEAEICAISGAEACRTDKRKAAAVGDNADMMQRALENLTSEAARRYNLVMPIALYPLFENAMRAHWKQSLAESQWESAQLWSDFSKVAAANEHAWIRREHTPQQILETGPRNRKLCFPYSTLMVANNSVNQGASMILASYAAAKRLGIPDEKMVFVGQGAAAAESHDIRERDHYYESPSMKSSLLAALERNRIEAADCDQLEIYSCFPCVPKYARRVVNFREGVALSAAGGLTFAGAPIRNYMMHAAAVMVENLRKGGRYGLMFANGGFMTEAHTIAVSNRPFEGVAMPADFDAQKDADALRRTPPPFVEDYTGTGTIETYTVAYGADGEPLHGTIVARNDEGARFFARANADDTELIAFLTDGKTEPVGQRGRVMKAAGGLSVWRMQ